MQPTTRRGDQPWRTLCVAGVGLVVLLALPRPIWSQAPAASNSPNPPTAPTSRGHAHNDYVHERPLLEALERGFASVEADIFLHAGQLLVGHTQLELRPERTLEGMYLQPLAEWISQHAGRVHRDDQPLLLLIDIKTDATSTWEALHPLLVKYRSMLSETTDGQFQPRAVTIVISGNRASDRILAAQPQLAGIDGRMSDLGGTLSSAEMPLVSDAWSKHFRWRGAGPMPIEEQKKLRELVSRSHAESRQVRFWATPESESLWSELKSAGVDLIGTDNLSQLETFLAAPPAAAKLPLPNDR